MEANESIEVSSTQETRSSGSTSEQVNLIQVHSRTSFRYKWTIPNFSVTATAPGQKITSPPFFVGPNRAKCNLQAYPNGQTLETKDHLGLFLCFMPVDVSKAVATCSLSILNSTQKQTNVIQFTHAEQLGTRCFSFGWDKFASADFLKNPANGCLPDDNLTILCDVMIEECTDYVNIDAEKIEVPECRILDDLGDLFESRKLCDVTLVASGQEFKAHKAILAARSPVFLKMFQDESMEQELDRVKVWGVDCDVLGEMLRFIYTGRTEHLGNMADRLIAAADKFELLRLKALCEEALCESLTTENVMSMLALGDSRDCVHLKTQAIDFIFTHTQEVMATASYKAMHYTNPDLIDKAFHAIATKKSRVNGCGCR